MKFLRWAFLDLKSHKRFTILFILNLALGLSGLLTLDSFKRHLEESLDLRSKSVLGADLGISSRKPITAEQEEAVSSELTQVSRSQMIETYSMISSEAGDSRLIQIKAIEKNFPFYGGIELLEKGLQTPEKLYDIASGKNVWVYPEVLPQLGLEIGDNLKIGKETFKISDVVKEDQAAGFMTSMAPRIYMSRKNLMSTGLINEQSLAWYSTVFKVGMEFSELKNYAEEVFDEKIKDESVRVYTHKNASDQMGRILGYLSDYLGLVSVAAIFLSSIGATFLFRSYISSKIKEIAVLRSLGMSHGASLGPYIWQTLFFGFCASALAFILSLILMPGLSQVLSQLTAFPIEMSLSGESISIAIILGVFGSLLVCLPILVQLKNIKPKILLSDIQEKLRPTKLSYLIHFFAALTLWLLAVWQSNSWLIGSNFFAAFLVCILLLSLFAYFFIWLFYKSSNRLPLFLKLPIRNLMRQPKMTASCFIALGMGLVLLNIVPQIESSIQMEIQQPESSRLPSFFIFDIQAEQVADFTQEIAESGHTMSQISPMIRGRIKEVNGESFEKVNANKDTFSREEKQEIRFRNRGFNFSYREKLDSSEKIIAGKGFSGRFDPSKDELVELSVEKRFAGRLDLEIGDIVTFEIQDVPMKAKIINLRSIKWTSFQPNFFLQVQPGVLEEAPQTYIATLVNMSEESKVSLQNLLVKKFPNISIIDVTRVVKRISGISSQMSTALQFMAILCLLVGLLVLYSISSHQAFSRQQDINLIKILGAQSSTIRNIFILEFIILAILAGVIGVILSVMVSYVISYFLFDGAWSGDLITPILSLVVLLILVSLLSYFSVRRVMQNKVKI